MSLLRNAPVAISDLLDILPDAVVMVDDAGAIAYANPAVHDLLGYTPSELIEKPLEVLLPPAVRERHAGAVAGYRRDGHPVMMADRPVLHALHRSGKPVPVSISLCNLAIEHGQWVSVAVLHDMSTLHTHLDRATNAAETDTLTGVGNRLRLTRRMQGMLDAERPFALLHVDLTAFKSLNDRLGHEAGDHVLRIVARRLQAGLREADLVARIGGDEFVVLLDTLQDPQTLEARAQSTALRLAQPIHVKSIEAPIVLGAHIGCAISPQHGRTAHELLAAADRAMYQAKQSRAIYRLASD